jgi:hypothetical protein
MSLKRVRRYYLHKRLEAAERSDDVLASTWQGKQEERPGVLLTQSRVEFPHRSKLEAVGYIAFQDVEGATVEELELIGRTKPEGASILAAVANETATWLLTEGDEPLVTETGAALSFEV